MKEIHDIVRNDYGKIALEETNATILSGNSSSETMSSSVGYTLMIWHLLQLNQILDLDVVIRTVKQISSPVKSSWISGARWP